MNTVVATGQSTERVGCPVLVLKIEIEEELTDHELELLRLVATGLTNAEIGEALFLAEITIKKYLEVVRQKLHAKNTVHAVVIALKTGLISFDTNMAQGPVN